MSHTAVLNLSESSTYVSLQGVADRYSVSPLSKRVLREKGIDAFMYIKYKLYNHSMTKKKLSAEKGYRVILKAIVS